MALLTPMQQMAVQVHEMFRAYVYAGFTEAQAMQLVITHMRSADNIIAGREQDTRDDRDEQNGRDG